VPKINVYLPDDLAEVVKQANLPVSSICQKALEQAVRRVAALHETMRGSVESGSDHLASHIQEFSRFTGRTQVVLSMAVEAARAQGCLVGTDHLLIALVGEGDGLGLRVLRSMEIEPHDLAAALAARPPSTAVTDRDEIGFAPDAQEALRLTVSEAVALGQNYIGSEHLLLGLIAEPDGPAGRLLRGAGAELRLARRAVSAAVAGWVARNEQAPSPSSGGPDVMAAVTETIREQLSPLVDRLDRLEQHLLR
jgi:ATP-dependent Clp protease ATP-binding subunit ClpA